MNKRARNSKQAAKQRRAERVRQRAELYALDLSNDYVFKNTSKQKRRHKTKGILITQQSAVVRDTLGAPYFCMKDHG